MVTSNEAQKSTWTSNIVSAVNNIKHRTLTNCRAVEMAFFEEGSDGLPVFKHSQLPLIQAQAIELIFSDGETLHIQTNQNDDSFGLLASYSQLYAIGEGPKPDKNSIFRLQENISVPLGLILHCETKFDDKSDVTEILVKTINGAFVMKAGEVYENMDGTHYLCSQDESVLLFLDVGSLSQVNFCNQIY